MHTPFVLSDEDVRQLGDGGLVQSDDFASAAEVDAWSTAISTHDDAFTSAGTGSRRMQGSARGDRTAWESDHPGVFVGLVERFLEVRDELNRAAWMGLSQFEVQLATYGPGAGYARHRDALRGDPSRRATAIVYLNGTWKAEHGGCLRVHTLDGPRDIEPRGGRLVVFLSDALVHEVMAGNAVRHAATAWFRGRP